MATAFIGDSSHIQDFVDQVNCTSKCSSPGCSGQLAVVCKKAQGLGGAIEVAYQCNGCLARSLTFRTSVVGEVSQQPLLSVAIQVAFICGGSTYAHYHKVLGKALGMCTVDEKGFYKTLQLMYPHCEAILNGMCQEAKEEMKAMKPSELGSWERAVTSGDAAWLTRGYHSQNCTFHVRNYMNGAVLYYRHLCQRGKIQWWRETFTRVLQSLLKAMELPWSSSRLRKKACRLRFTLRMEIPQALYPLRNFILKHN